MNITVRFQHGGQFEFKDDRLVYRKGKIFNKRDVDSDLLSKIELEGFLRDEIGINDVKELWYLEAGKSISTGLRQILIDSDIVSMTNSVGADKTVHVYVVQKNDFSPTPFKRAPPKGLNLRSSPKKLIPRRDQQALSFKQKQPNPIPFDIHTPLKNIVTQEQFDEVEEEEDIVVGSDSSSSGTDYDFQVSEDEDDDIFQDNVDESVQDDVGLLVAHNDGGNFEDELEFEGDPEILLSLSDSDGEKKQRYPEFNPVSDFKTAISLQSGMRFGSNDIFRRALRQHSIENGGDFYYLHNDQRKVSAYCKYKCDCSMQHSRKKCICKKIYCGFKACARRVGEDGTFQLKTWSPKHTCYWRIENAKVTSKWLVEKYIEHYRADPKWSISGFMSTVLREYTVEITYIQAWRARMRAYMMIQGDVSGQYAKVWDYAATLMKFNPGSSTLVKVCNDVVERPLFQRLYICLDACKKGFIMGCRPIIGLDGCHLKGPYTGQILAAIAKDGNENIFPVAYVVVEAERKDTWCWFLENLMQDLGDLSVTFMSDRQKGLLEALKLIVPMAETRVCVRHLYNNFKVKWPGKAFKDTLWAAARAWNEVDFEEEMAHMKSLGEGAYAYLMRADPNTWARHRFKLCSKSDMLLNNVCESFNNFILPSRDKPILTMCEWIRRALMKRFMSKRSGMSSCASGPMTPRAQKRVEYAMTEAARTCRVLTGGGDRYEVDRFDKRYVVDLAQRSCGCNKWDLTGIPCPHAVACIIMRRGRLENFVDKYYTKETYMNAYGHILEPIPGHKQWVKTGQTPPDPPMLIVQPGRPKKARRKEQGEEMPRKHIRVCVKYKCSQCGQQGHHKKRCNNPPSKANMPKPSNKGGRPINRNTIRIASNKRRITTQNIQGQPTTSTHGQYEASVELRAPIANEVDHISTMQQHHHQSTQFQSQQSSTSVGNIPQQTSQFSWGKSYDGSAGTSKVYFPSSQAKKSVISSTSQLIDILNQSGRPKEVPKKK